MKLMFINPEYIYKTRNSWLCKKSNFLLYYLLKLPVEKMAIFQKNEKGAIGNIDGPMYSFAFGGFQYISKATYLERYLPNN